MDFLVAKDNLRECRLQQSAPQVLADGDVLLAISKFSFTTNNVTYAKSGAMPGFNYWKFYSPEGPDGRIPVWGLARVVASRHPDVAANALLYGFFPMSTYVVLRPKRMVPRVDAFLVDRPGLADAYNTYNFCDADPFYDEASADLMLLFRPLFATGWLLEDFIRTNAYFGAAEILLSSASSKTSISLAFMLKRGGYTGKIVGLTSPGNVAFVTGLGIFDRQVTYTAIAASFSGLAASTAVAYVDMAGNAAVNAAVHGCFGAMLKHSCVVGNSHWEAGTIGNKSAHLPGPKPKLFFAPGYKVKGGMAAMLSRMPADWMAMMIHAGSWMAVKRLDGAGVVQGYTDLVNGICRPNEGIIMSLAEPGAKL